MPMLRASRCSAPLCSWRVCPLQGTKQKEFGISATQLQAGIAPWQSIQAAVVSLATECYCYDESAHTCDSVQGFFLAAYGGNELKRHVLLIVLGTCFLALLVNLCSFGLIGRTSPITFQVVGHAKTCLVLAGGFFFFPSTVRAAQRRHAAPPRSAAAQSRRAEPPRRAAAQSRRESPSLRAVKLLRVVQRVRVARVAIRPPPLPSRPVAGLPAGRRVCARVWTMPAYPRRRPTLSS